MKVGDIKTNYLKQTLIIIRSNRGTEEETHRQERSIKYDVVLKGRKDRRNSIR